MFEEAMRELGLEERGSRAGRDDETGEMAALMAELDETPAEAVASRARRGGRVEAGRRGPDLSAEDRAFLEAMGTLDPDAVPEPPETPRRERPPMTAGSKRTLSRRIKVGTIKEERVLDLHGKTRDAAFEELRRFVARARADGVRVVKVISGRGLHSAGDAVLRRALEPWLTRDLREQVQELVKAPPGHGGEGATYVILRPPSR